MPRQAAAANRLAVMAMTREERTLVRHLTWKGEFGGTTTLELLGGETKTEHISFAGITHDRKAF